MPRRDRAPLYGGATGWSYAAAALLFASFCCGGGRCQDTEVPAPAPPVNATQAPEEEGEVTQTFIAIVIIVGLSIFGIFLYIWYSKSESRKNRNLSPGEGGESHQPWMDSRGGEGTGNSRRESPEVVSPLPVQPPPPLSVITPAEDNAPRNSSGLSGNGGALTVDLQATGGSDSLHDTITSPLLPESTVRSARNSLDRKSFGTQGTHWTRGTSGSGPYQIGDAVVGKKGAERSRGKIVADNRDGTYTLQYEDGDFDTKAAPATLYPVGLYQVGDMVEHTPSSSPCYVTGYGDAPGVYHLSLLPEFNSANNAGQNLRGVPETYLQPRQAGGLDINPLREPSGGGGAYSVGAKVAARASGPTSPARSGVIQAVRPADAGLPTYTVVFANGDVASQVDASALLPLACSRTQSGGLASGPGGGRSAAGSEVHIFPPSGSSKAERKKRGVSNASSKFSGFGSPGREEGQGGGGGGVSGAAHGHRSFGLVSSGGRSDALETLVGLHTMATSPVTPMTPARTPHQRYFPRMPDSFPAFTV